MTWEETILYAREKDELKQLIEDSYLSADLKKNVENFSNSEEFIETLFLINKFISTKTSSIKILDIGAGNGISSIAFALNGFAVTAIEPDPSNTIGANAINTLKNEYNLSNITVNTSYGESLPFENESFDVVYARQAMHHANNLNAFVKESARVLKKNGLFFTCRDHVVNDAMQKTEFLNSHPLQKFYNGENAFSINEYKIAFIKANLTLKLKLGPLDSVINYNPKTKSELTMEFREILEKKIRLKLPDNNTFNAIIFTIFKLKTYNLHNNAGRLYSFIAHKV